MKRESVCVDEQGYMFVDRQEGSLREQTYLVLNLLALILEQLLPLGCQGRLERRKTKVGDLRLVVRGQ